MTGVQTCALRSSKIPKKTWYIIVAILLALAGFFALSRSWFWICWEGVAMALVAVGCIGEFAMLRRIPAPGHEESHRQRELWWVMRVAIGVTMELFSFPRTISEWWEMEEGIANANALSSSNAVQVAKLTSTNLLIQKSTLELAHKYDLCVPSARVRNFVVGSR